MPDRPAPRVVVVGAGVTGLAAAWRLAEQGAAVQLLDASSRIGGQVHTVALRGRMLDLGAEAVHLAAPGTRELIDELALTDAMLASGTGGTLIGSGRGLAKLPEGVGPAGPTRIAPLIRSGILGPTGLARAALEPIVARRAATGTEDQSVRDFVARRFGAQVADRLVDPLVGGLHSGDIADLSLQSATPALAALARSGRSVTLSRTARRERAAVPAAGFVTWPDGLRRLPEQMLARSGAALHLGARVTAIEPQASGYAVGVVEGPAETTLEADAVVLAVAAHVAAQLLGPLVPEAAELLAAQRFASVATVTLAFPGSVRADVPALAGTGILLASTTKRVLKAATFLSTKWPHLDRPDDYLLRMSAGRAGVTVADDLDDDELVTALLADLGELTGLRADPLEMRVQRWPRTMPQLEVGHADRLARIRTALTAYPGIELAGASYDGVGIVSCVRSARRAADRIATARFGAE